MTIRERTEAIEKDTMCEYACFSDSTKGRKTTELPCDIRTEFQRDRDRIIHSKAFRRLKHKTQVFLLPEGDHYRTRLTHTLEVSQIARTIARALRLNEDLVEAISLGHDLGHTPFGHAGERALDKISRLGFAHYDQSVRICEKLEKDGEGLNLTYEVLDGIRCHTKGEQAKTLEGRIVRLADKIAYINHDIDDSIRAGIISDSDIPQDIRMVLGERHSQRINIMVTDTIMNSDADDIKMSDLINDAFWRLHEFMFENVYLNPKAKGEEGKAEALIMRLYNFFIENSSLLPDEFKTIAFEDGAERAALDYISGMSDIYAVTVYNDLFIPRAWEQ